MNYLEGNFNLGLQDGLEGVIIQDVTTVSTSDNKVVKKALHEYRSGVILGQVIKEYNDEHLLDMEMI